MEVFWIKELSKKICVKIDQIWIYTKCKCHFTWWIGISEMLLSHHEHEESKKNTLSAIKELHNQHKKKIGKV